MRAGLLILMAIAFLTRGVQAAEQPAGSGPKTRFDGMQISAEHPRIWLDAAKVAWLKKKVEGKSVDEVKALAGTSVEGLSLTYVITGDEKTGREAIAKVSSAARTDVRQAAVCYDWCYPLLSADEKKAIRDKVMPSCRKGMATPRSWRSFHNSLYSAAVPISLAAIAFYGDDPYGEEAFAFINPEWEDVLRTFENVFSDGAWGEGFDYNRHVSYEALRYFTALKTATGKDFIADSKHLANTAYYILYSSKANGLVFPEKDCDWPFIGPWEHEALLVLASEYRNGYCQHYLNHCPAANFVVEGRDKWKELLWHDSSIKEADPAGLPLSRIFRDDGLVIARSGWGWDSEKERAGDTWVAFRCGKYYGDHVHYDNNSFEIYQRGELAIDSGRYDDDWGMEEDPAEIVKSEFFNYYQRTIAHNSVLVYDPEEEFELGVLNDGGQQELLRINGVRNVPEDYDQGNFPSEGAKKGTCDWATNPGRWDTAEILAYKATDDFTYVSGDATKSYSAKKLKSFVRQFVFIQPNIIVVFDRVVSTEPQFKKTWLLHTINEPAVAEDGKRFEANYGDGRLVCVPLLPAKRAMTKVGGPDDECMVAGVRFHYGMNASSGRQAELHYGELPGQWRMEESPSEPAAADSFLNVILVTDSASKEVPVISGLEETGDTAKVTVTTADGTAAALAFAKEGTGRTTLKLTRGGKVVFDGAMPQGVELEQGRP